MIDNERDYWRAIEYDAAAAWCARHGLKGKPGDELPNLLASDVREDIDAAPERFEQRVSDFAYALAMERIYGDRDADEAVRS